MNHDPISFEDPEDVLERARSVIAHDGARNGLIVIGYDRGDEGDEFNLVSLTYGMRYMEVVTVLEALKFDILAIVRRPEDRHTEREGWQE